jgi:CTP synthase
MGICLGFQLAVVEYARHVLGWSRATSAEFVANTEASSSPPASPALSDDTSPPTSPMARLALANNKSQQPQHVIISMPEVSITHLGGTMRIGARTSVVTPGSLTASIYGGATHIEERHRHRYEVNPTHVPALTKAGLIFSGVDKEERVRMECLELAKEVEHPFFWAHQGHVEFNSGPFAPSPPFCAFVRAASKHAE